MNAGNGLGMIATACAGALIAGAAPGQGVTYETAKLLASDGAAGDYFGISVAMSGDVIVIGSPYDDDTGEDSGSAYVYRYDGSTWVEEAKLLVEGAAGDRFGYAVAMSGELIVVGAYLHDGVAIDTGAAYVFRYDGSTWLEEMMLKASDGASDDRFGRSVAVAGDVIACGATHDDDNGMDSGSAYVFRHDGSIWVEEAKLVASDGQAGSWFGYAVEVEGDRLMVGAPKDGGSSHEWGAVYVFERIGASWNQTAKLFDPDGYHEQDFGQFVSLEGDAGLIGAPGNIGHSAMIFEHDGTGWSETYTFLGSGGYDRYGRSGAFGGDVAMVGAPFDSTAAEHAGAVFVYRDAGVLWELGSVLLASDALAYDELGRDVAFDSGLVLAGAPFRADLGDYSGAAYVFSVPEVDCNGNGVPDYIDIANGTSLDCNNNAVPDECDIADGTSWDCNHNGVPDECDIASGFSEDLNGDGIPDECLPPGSAGLVPLLQTRTLYALGRDDENPPPYGCFVEEYDEAPDFTPYVNTLHANCWPGVGTASQQSFLDLTDISATGSVSGDGCDGGGCHYTGIGESIFDVTFGAPVSQWITISGNLATGGSGGGVSATGRIELSDAPGQILLEVELYYEPGNLDFRQPVQLQEGASYTLHAEAYAHGSYYDGTGDYSVALTLLGDLTGDWAVDVIDLLLLLAAWGPCPPGECPADLNGDGSVDVLDLLLLLGNWS